MPFELRDFEMPLAFGSAIAEIGVPAALIILMVQKPHHRPFASFVLGALTPLLAFYVLGLFDHLMDPTGKDTLFDLHLMWLRSFTAFLMLLVPAVVISALLKKPMSPTARFFLGLLIPIFYIACDYVSR